MSGCRAALHFLPQHPISAANAVFAERMIDRATVPGNDCMLITYGTFQDPQGLSQPHKNHTIPLNQTLTHRQGWYAMNDAKSYCTKKMAVFQSRTVYSKTHRACLTHKKYWTHRSIIEYYTISLNQALTQRQVWYAMNDAKIYCTKPLAASPSRAVHSKPHRLCPIHTSNIEPIGPLSSIIPWHWIEPLPKSRSDIQLMIQRNTVPGKCLRPNHER